LIPNVLYSSRHLAVQTGDLVVIATDGVLDAEDAKREPFGLDRLGSLLLEDLTAPLDEIAERIRNVSRLGFRQVDDQTLLLIRFA
jgi:serine phosphatase RsbU (regulator of sigma subunit)